MKASSALLLFLCCIPSIAAAQEAQPAAPAPRFTLPNFGFDAVAIVQLAGGPGAETLTVTYPDYREVPRQQTVTKSREEIRTRLVTFEVDGKPLQREETYSVQVPYTEETTVLELVADDMATDEIPLATVRFYDIQGRPVDLPTLQQRLSRRTGVVYLGQAPLANGSLPATSLYASILRSNLLFFTGTGEVTSFPQASDEVGNIPAPVVEPAPVEP